MDTYVDFRFFFSVNNVAINIGVQKSLQHTNFFFSGNILSSGIEECVGVNF